MIGRESETLKPVKWLKIENSETDEEDSALGISSGASSSSELGQERFFMIFSCSSTLSFISERLFDIINASLKRALFHIPPIAPIASKWFSWALKTQKF